MSDLVIECFPHGSPGAPIAGAHQGSTTYESTQAMLGDSIWAPFHSQCDWEVARWAKMRGPTSSAVTDLLAIKEVCSLHILFIISLTYWWKVVEKLGLSYKTANELNEIIDKELPGRPAFRCRELVIGGEQLEFHYREAIPCIRALYGDPEFADHLVFAPERHYTDREKTCRVYSEMHTGDWWWSVQVRKGSLESFTYLQVIPVVT